MSVYYYPAVFHKAESKQGYWVSFPDLDGCVSEGNDLQEAVSMASEALGLYIDVIKKDLKTDLPVPSNPEDITLDHTDFVIIIEYVSIPYTKKLDFI